MAVTLKTALLHLACAASLLVYPSAAFGQEAAEPHIEKAKQDIQRKEHWLAKRRLKLALRLNPNITEAYYLLALSQCEEGEKYEAINNVSEALRRQEHYPEARHLLARLYFETGSLKFARQELDRAFAQGQPSSGLYKLKGDIEYAAGDRKLALQFYEEALHLAAPDDEDAPKIRERADTLRRFFELKKQFLELHGDQDDSQYTKPVLLNLPRPNYTEEARNRKINGSIEMAVLIDEKGNVSSVFLFSGLGYGLDEEATRVARELKFSPALRDGKPVPYWGAVSIEFNLQ